MKARDNPFRSQCLERLAYREPGFSWDDLDARLIAAGGRGAIVGPEGHGKTTLLLQWRDRWEASGWKTVFVRAGRGQRRLCEAQKRGLLNAEAVFADSAEQLGWGGWREFLSLTRSTKLVIITTHRPGRFATIHACRTSASLLHELVNELHEPHEDCQALWQRHQGNLRNALRELYDQIARGMRSKTSAMPTCPLKKETA